MAKGDDKKGRDSLIPIARDVIKHAKEGTLRQAKEVMQLPAENYTDPDRFEAELNQVIKRVPIILGPSCEIPNPGDFKTLSLAGKVSAFPLIQFILLKSLRISLPS